MDVADLNPRRNAEQFVDELLDILRRQPGRAKPHVNLGGGQIRRLHRFQRLDIFTKTNISNTGGVGGDELLSDIAGKVLIFGFPLPGLRMEKNHSFQFG